MNAGSPARAPGFGGKPVAKLLPGGVNWTQNFVATIPKLGY